MGEGANRVTTGASAISFNLSLTMGWVGSQVPGVARSEGGSQVGLRHALLSQRGTLLLWLPICLGAGIGLYFALPREPSVAELWGLAALAGGLVVISAAMGEAARPIAWAVAPCGSG